ncbi:MAG: hypothetical protein GEU79_10035 [Acidimicrobiia bacterium]|nr:hypothetical protein [Acidimicrobiia bacterium]
MSEGAHHTPTPAQYWKIALGLAVVTGIEVSLYYVDQALELGVLNAAMLIGLSFIKFFVVVGWFMHLKYEKPALSRFFTSGFILALTLYAVVLGFMAAAVLNQ